MSALTPVSSAAAQCLGKAASLHLETSSESHCGRDGGRRGDGDGGGRHHAGGHVSVHVSAIPEAGPTIRKSPICSRQPRTPTPQSTSAIRRKGEQPPPDQSPLVRHGPSHRKATTNNLADDDAHPRPDGRPRGPRPRAPVPARGRRPALLNDDAEEGRRVAVRAADGVAVGREARREAREGGVGEPHVLWVHPGLSLDGCRAGFQA